MMEENVPPSERDVQKSEVREFDDYIIDFDNIEFTCKICNKTNSSCEHFIVRICSDRKFNEWLNKLADASKDERWFDFTFNNQMPNTSKPEFCEECLDHPDLLCGIRIYNDCLAVWRREKRPIILRAEKWSVCKREILAFELTSRIIVLAIELDPRKIEGDEP